MVVMRRRWLVPASALVAAGLLGVSGCAVGGSTPAAEGATTATPSASPSPTARAAAQANNADLVSFSCAPDGAGVWNASGVIVNSGSMADFRITVLVAPPGSTGGTARRVVVPGVKTGIETPFTIAKLPVNAGQAPSCRVQLDRLD